MVTSLFIWHVPRSILWKLCLATGDICTHKKYILIILIRSLDACFVSHWIPPFSLWLAELEFTCLMGLMVTPLWHVLSVCCRFGHLRGWVSNTPWLKPTRPWAADVYSRSKAKSTDIDQARWGNWRWSRRKYCLPLIVLSLFFPNKTEHWHFGENFYFPFLICVWLCPNYFKSNS